MLPEIWEPRMKVVFVGTVVSELSDTLGFYHLHKRDRFWELIEMATITPKRFLTPQEGKALADGHRDGSLSDPVRMMFIQKRTSQLLQLGIGFTDLNRRMIAGNEKDKFARPTEEDICEFVEKAERLEPRVLAFVTSAYVFVESFKSRYPDARSTLGPQPFKIGTSEVWLLGSTSGSLRGEALSTQEDLFVALGERIAPFRAKAPE